MALAFLEIYADSYCFSGDAFKTMRDIISSISESNKVWTPSNETQNYLKSGVPFTQVQIVPGSDPISRRSWAKVTGAGSKSQENHKEDSLGRHGAPQTKRGTQRYT